MQSAVLVCTVNTLKLIITLIILNCIIDYPRKGITHQLKHNKFIKLSVSSITVIGVECNILVNNFYVNVQ